MACWLVLCAVLGVFGFLRGVRTTLPGPASQDALLRYPGEQVAFEAGIPPADTLIVVVRHGELVARDPVFLSALDALISRLQAAQEPGSLHPLFPSVRTLGNSMALDEDELFVSADRHGVIIIAQSDLPIFSSSAALEGIPALVAEWKGSYPSFVVGYLSQGTADNEIFALIDHDLDTSLLVTLPLTLGILLWAFQSVAAALVPLIIALGSLAASLGATAAMSHLVGPVSATAAQLVVLLVLAVGVDYSLFIVSRVREEIRGGAPFGEAVQRARVTAGTAVMWSGITVGFSLAGLLLMNDTVLTSMAHVSILAVLITVLSTILVVPSLLLILRRYLIPSRKTAAGRSSLAAATLNRPVVTVLVSVGVLLLLAVPGLRLALGSTMERDMLPTSMQSASAFAMLRRDFPKHAGTSFSIVTRADEDARDREDAIDSLFAQMVSEHEVSGPVAIRYAPNESVARYEFLAAGNGNDERNQRFVGEFRTSYAPALLNQSGVQAWISGMAPYVVDEARRYRARTLLALLGVLGVSFLFLLVAFRSLAIACKAIVMNLLSVGAAFGVLTLLFQSPSVAVWNYGVIESFVPALLFSILFGLSMDYHVFLISRIREEARGGRALADGVREGITTTSRTITSAALIMTGVFAVIASLELPVMKQLGVGLAVAVLLDATVIRSMLLPSSMILLGRWNWYLPRWLAWLPSLELEKEMSSRSPGRRAGDLPDR